MITQFLRPASAEEALRAQKATENAVFLAGGTHLLSPALRERAMAAVSIEGLLPRDIRISGELLSIGALATLQELIESGERGQQGAPPSAAAGARAAGGAAGPVAALARSAPAAAAGIGGPELRLLCEAASSLANRNLRNRATVGGNIAANKPAACLAPALLALDAQLRLVGGSRPSVAEYLAAPGGLIETAEVALVAARSTAYRRWARTRSDVSGVAAAVSLRLAGSAVSGVRVAVTGVRSASGEAGGGSRRAEADQGAAPAGGRVAWGGFGAARLPEVEALFEGRALPERREIEQSILPLIAASSDIRASAAYRRLRAAQLIADALLAAASSAAAPSAGAGSSAAGSLGSSGRGSPGGGAPEAPRGKETTR